MMGIRFVGGAVLGLVALLAVPPAHAEAPVLSDVQKTAIEKLVHDYLLENPEILVEAMTVLRGRQEQAETADRVKALKESHTALFNNPHTPVVGNPAGDVSIVEFFDYACPYCKSVEEAVLTLLKDDGKIRLVLKEFPVLGPNSVLASRAALAALWQGQAKYEAFHNALMTTRGQFGDETLMRIAHSVGLDTDRLKTDMARPEIEAEISANHHLADQLAIHGTPAFVVGNDVYPGAMELSSLKQVVAEARKQK